MKVLIKAIDVNQGDKVLASTWSDVDASCGAIYVEVRYTSNWFGGGSIQINVTPYAPQHGEPAPVLKLVPPDGKRGR